MLEILRNIAELDQLVDEILLASRLDAREADVGTVEDVDLIGLAAEECARVDADLDVSAVPEGLEVRGISKTVAPRHSQPAGKTPAATARAKSPCRCCAQRHPGRMRCDRGLACRTSANASSSPSTAWPGASERSAAWAWGWRWCVHRRRHNGSVHCEDHAGGGACFVPAPPLALTKQSPPHKLNGPQRPAPHHHRVQHGTQHQGRAAATSPPG